MKSLKNLVIPFVILLILIGGLIIWSAVSSKKNADEGAGEEQTSVTVLSLSSYDVRKLSVEKKQGDTITVESQIDDKNVQTWDLTSGDNGVEYSQDAIRSYVSILCNYTANSVVKDHADLSEYGLDDPDYKVYVETFSGNSYNVLIGNQAFDSSKCYFMLEGDDNVYVTAAAKRIYSSYTLIDFLSTQLLNIEYANISTISFDRTSDDTHLVAECHMEAGSTEPAYQIVEPFHIPASAYFKNLVEYIATLEITRFIDIDEDEIADYGLDNPEYVFVFNMKTGETIEIRLSSLIGENYYGTCSGIDGYFVINYMQINGLDIPMKTLLDSYITYYHASEVSSIRGEYEGRTFDFEIDTDSAISDDGATVTLDLRNALVRTSTGRSYAAILFEALATIQIGDIDDSAVPEGEPVLKLTYVLKNYTTIEVEFVNRSQDSYYVFMDGVYTGFIVYSDELFHDGGTDTYSYGAWSAYELADTALSHAINGIYDIPDTTSEAA